MMWGNLMEREERRPVELFKSDAKCPNCGSDAKLVVYKYSIPYYGDIGISVLECGRCGHVHRDVFTLRGGAPRKIVYRVEKPGDENALVIRSSHCRIEIPELGLAVEPGIYSQGYITTVEGIIQDFIDALESICSSDEAPRDKCEELRALLEKAKNAEVKYTVILYDYLGSSDVLSSKTTYEELEEG